MRSADMTGLAGIAGWGGLLLLATLGSLGAQGQTQAPSAPELPRLTGIVIAGKQRVAIFESAPGSASSVEEGETVAAYTVRSIELDGVQIEREGRSFALALTHSAQVAVPVDTGGVTFGLVVNPRRPPDD